MILQIEGRATIFILLKFVPAQVKELPVLFRVNAGDFFKAGRTVTGKRENVYAAFYYYVNKFRYFVNVRAWYRSHYDASHSGVADTRNFFKGRIKRAAFAYAVMGPFQAVKGKLVTFATARVKPPAYFIGKMKGIAHKGKTNVLRFQQFQQPPIILMQKRVAPGDVKVGNTVKPSAHFLAVVHYFLHIGKRHFRNGETAVFRKNITVFTPLVAVARYMPLK
jgi:hypothetical protein